MKKIILPVIFLITFIANGQTLEVFQIETLYKLQTLEKKCDYLYDKGFVKESSNESQNVKLIKKKFVKKTQEFEIEIVNLTNDSIIYSMNDPKSFVKFKRSVGYYYKEEPKDKNSLDVNFKSKKDGYKIRETDEKRENTTMKFYNFIYYRTVQK